MKYALLEDGRVYQFDESLSLTIAEFLARQGIGKDQFTITEEKPAGKDCLNLQVIRDEALIGEVIVD